MFDRDRNLTLIQNYKALGLISRLNGATGGREKKISHNDESDITGAYEHGVPGEKGVDGLAIPGNKRVTKLIPTEARVERDPETGRILRVLRPESTSQRGEEGGDVRLKRKRLDDPLNSDEESGVEETRPITASGQARGKQSTTGAVAALEAQAEEEAAQMARTKRPRQQSKREEEWIAALVGKYGDNVGAMVRDRRLNPMQQSEADIGRRVRKWRDSRDRGPVVEAMLA